MGIIDSAIDALRFKDTIFFKENSELQDRYNALIKLKEEYPNNKALLNELAIVKKGLDGENEIAYQLKKAHIGMYVLRDVKIKFEDLTAQIDFVVLTAVYTYFIECKNMQGNIIVNENGDFIQEITVNGKKIRKGMYSPLRQVEAQREVLRKYWESHASTFQKLFASNKFEYYRRVLVVAANKDTLLNIVKAPEDIKNKVLRADALVKHIQYEIDNRVYGEYVESKKSLEEAAQSYMDALVDDNRDYYKEYKNKFCQNSALKEQLEIFRIKRAKERNIPAYYVFTNEELDKIVEHQPKNIDELRKLNILPDIKVKVHGTEIVNVINKMEK